MLGAVPSGGCDLAAYFQPVIADAQDAVATLQGAKRGRPPRQLQQAEKRLEDLKAAQDKLHACLVHRAGWLMFFYTDAAHRCIALRLRQPYSKQFVSFKPGIAGVFGRELFTPYTSPQKQALNDFLIVTEGEFNALQLQSLTLRYEEATGQPQGYLNACAVGGVLVADTSTIQRVSQHPVIGASPRHAWRLLRAGQAHPEGHARRRPVRRLRLTQTSTAISVTSSRIMWPPGRG